MKRAKVKDDTRDKSIKRQTSAPEPCQKAPTEKDDKTLILRQKSGHRRSIYESPSSRRKHTSGADQKERRLMLVRGHSCTLIDVDIYIESLGSVENSESVPIMPQSIMSPKTRTRMYLKMKKENNAEASIKNFIITLLIMVIILTTIFVWCFKN